mgnify:CR=1 FL=1
MKKEYEDGYDIRLLLRFIGKYVPGKIGNRKLKYTKKRIKRLLNHPHKAIRWLVIAQAPSKFTQLIEDHYYRESRAVVRKMIIENTKDINLLGYAMLKDKHQELRNIASRRYTHLFNKMEEKNEKSNIVDSTI